MAFGVWLRSVTLWGPSPIQCSTSMTEHATLHLNAFRGEPAITEFDWPFTPYHRSSPKFSSLVGSALHEVLPSLQPAHGKITRLRVYRMRLNALFRLAFASAPLHRLTSPHTVTRWLILQKARHCGCQQADNYALTVCKPTVSGLTFTPLPGYFSPFPHGTSSLSVV